MEQRIAVGLSALLVSGVVAQLLKVVWLIPPIPQGVTLIAIVIALVFGLAAWMKWLKMLRRRQIKAAKRLQKDVESFSYLIQSELVEQELDLTPDAQHDLQTTLLRVEQALPLVMGAIGVLLGLF
ncbi:hypothetical protein [Leptolyngbya sp. FACHB-711]|uniref:hypothetical protein n=1 Tax=Leptolyngbya sp. FACHB-711 TaxID=2692813 RepID=UPI0016879340|nr:hypothetical protein [Leptolyngbya sp. FACHB-711]MBD2024200.1 hypothetical protein [Leptolyngbya sp. FACHB-711]